LLLHVKRRTQSSFAFACSCFFVQSSTFRPRIAAILRLLTLRLFMAAFISCSFAGIQG